MHPVGRTAHPALRPFPSLFPRPLLETCNIHLIINVVGMLCSRVNSGIARRDELEAGSCLPDCLASF